MSCTSTFNYGQSYPTPGTAQGTSPNNNQAENEQVNGKYIVFDQKLLRRNIENDSLEDSSTFEDWGLFVIRNAEGNKQAIMAFVPQESDYGARSTQRVLSQEFSSTFAKFAAQRSYGVTFPPPPQARRPVS